LQLRDDFLDTAIEKIMNF